MAVRLRESSRPELGDLVGRATLEDGGCELADWTCRGGVVNIRWRDAALLQALHSAVEPPAGRGLALHRLSVSLGARFSVPLHFRALWLGLESAQHWALLQGGLAAHFRRGVSQALDRIFEREPLAGDQERAGDFRRLAELAAAARALGALYDRSDP